MELLAKLEGRRLEDDVELASPVGRRDAGEDSDDHTGRSGGECAYEERGEKCTPAFRAGSEPDDAVCEGESGRVVTRAGAWACGREAPWRKRSAGLLQRRGGLAQNRCRGLHEGAACGRSSFTGDGLAVRATPHALCRA